MTPFRKSDAGRSNAAPHADWEEHGHQRFQAVEKGENVLELLVIGGGVLVLLALGISLMTY